MSKSELARNIGISRQMIYKLMAKGMPIDDLESALAWRKHHLNPRKTKSWKAMVTEVKRKNRPWLVNQNCR